MKNFKLLTLLSSAIISTNAFPVTKSPTVDWDYRSTSIEIGGDWAGTSAYPVVDTIKHIKDYNLNTLTIDMKCGEEPLDEDLSDAYPLMRRIGCKIPYRQGNLTDLMIEEAKKSGLKVNLKPAYLEITDRVLPAKYREGKLPVDVFFDGEGGFDGYVKSIYAIAKYAESKKVDYLSIGTELSNLNMDIVTSKRWPEIISNIRKLYSGQLIYAHNLGPAGSVQIMRDQAFIDLLKNVDVIGINYYPANVMNGRQSYTADQVSDALLKATASGYSMIDGVKALKKATGKKFILSETTFPTWKGSANWMFRHTCDYQHKNKAGWEFTVGPLQAKTPDNESARILAEGWIKAMSQQDWVGGADYLYWVTALEFSQKPDSNWNDCKGSMWTKSSGVKEMIRDFHK